MPLLIGERFPGRASWLYRAQARGRSARSHVHSALTVPPPDTRHSFPAAPRAALCSRHISQDSTRATRAPSTYHPCLPCQLRAAWACMPTARMPTVRFPRRYIYTMPTALPPQAPCRRCSRTRCSPRSSLGRSAAGRPRPRVIKGGTWHVAGRGGLKVARGTWGRAPSSRPTRQSSGGALVWSSGGRVPPAVPPPVPPNQQRNGVALVRGSGLGG